jgi:hypothetical protein
MSLYLSAGDDFFQYLARAPDMCEALHIIRIFLREVYIPAYHHGMQVGTWVRSGN